MTEIFEYPYQIESAVLPQHQRGIHNLWNCDFVSDHCKRESWSIIEKALTRMLLTLEFLLSNLCQSQNHSQTSVSRLLSISQMSTLLEGSFLFLLGVLHNQIVLSLNIDCATRITIPCIVLSLIRLNLFRCDNNQLLFFRSTKIISLY